MGVVKSVRDLQKQAIQIERSMPPAGDRMAAAQARMAGAGQALVVSREPLPPARRLSICEVLRCTHSQACWQAARRPSPGPSAGPGAGRGARAGRRRCRGGRDPHRAPGQHRRGGQPRPGPAARDGHRGAVAIPRPVHRVAIARTFAIALAKQPPLTQPVTKQAAPTQPVTVTDHVTLTQPVTVTDHVTLTQPVTVPQQVGVAVAVEVALARPLTVTEQVSLAQRAAALRPACAQQLRGQR
jgi:hypothetical protein